MFFCENSTLMQILPFPFYSARFVCLSVLVQMLVLALHWIFYFNVICDNLSFFGKTHVKPNEKHDGAMTATRYHCPMSVKAVAFKRCCAQLFSGNKQ